MAVPTPPPNKLAKEKLVGESEEEVSWSGLVDWGCCGSCGCDGTKELGCFRDVNDEGGTQALVGGASSKDSVRAAFDHIKTIFLASAESEKS